MVLETFYGVVVCIILMLYMYEKHPKLYPVHILFMILIPIYVIAEWSNLDLWFAVFGVLFPVILEFFILMDINRKGNL